MTCDETCATREIELKRIAEENERCKREVEEQRNRLELEEFEKKFSKKKYKERKTQFVENKDNSLLIKWTLLAVLIAILSIFGFYLVFSTQ